MIAVSAAMLILDADVLKGCFFFLRFLSANWQRLA
jgi:hypothetical protein